jgi:hypothetical protein
MAGNTILKNWKPMLDFMSCVCQFIPLTNQMLENIIAQLKIHSAKLTTSWK